MSSIHSQIAFQFALTVLKHCQYACIDTDSISPVLLDEFENSLADILMGCSAVLWDKSWVWRNSGAIRRQGWRFCSSWRLLQLKLNTHFLYLSATNLHIYSVLYDFLLFFSLNVVTCFL